VVRGSFQKGVPDKKNRKQKNRKIEKSFSPKDQKDLRRIRRLTLQAPGGGHFDLLEKTVSIY